MPPAPSHHSALLPCCVCFLVLGDFSYRFLKPKNLKAKNMIFRIFRRTFWEFFGGLEALLGTILPLWGHLGAPKVPQGRFLRLKWTKKELKMEAKRHKFERCFRYFFSYFLISFWLDFRVKTFFGGAFWVYVNGDVHTRPKLEKVIYNDFNRYMVNLFECCKTPQEFYDSMMEIKAQDEELFYKFKKEVFEDNDVNNVKLGDFDFGMK